jgi:hypothetical protein
MKTISYGKYKTIFPEGLGDLSEKQLLQLASVFTENHNLMDAKVKLAYLWVKNVFDYNEARIKDTLERMRRTDIPEQKEVLSERLEDCYYHRMHLAELANWITEPQTCDKWIVSRLKIRSRIFWVKEFMGPSLRFGNIQFWEWCRAEQYFSNYIETGDRTSFNKFCACIYHPAQGSIRPAFEDAMVNENYKYFDRLKPNEVFAIRLNYIAVKNWLRLLFAHLFTNREDKDTTDKEDMADLLLRHADLQKVHYKIVEKDPLLVALKQLNMRAKDAKEKEANTHD